LENKNVNKVWEGFDEKVGARVNLSIWKQKRFKEVAYSKPHITGDQH
jgi:hypothetical protein